MPEVSVRQAARRLGVHVTRVRALLRAGDLDGRRIGGRWLVDEASANARAQKAVAEGRPFSARRAWAYLLLLTGEQVPWLDRATRSRLRARILRERVEHVLPRLRRRAQVSYFRASLSALLHIAGLPGFVPSGVSAAVRYGASIIARDQLDGYIGERELREASYRLALESVEPSLANIVLRVPRLDAVLRGRGVAPSGAVAVDMMDSPDQCTSRAGIEMAKRLRADRAAAR